MPKTKNIFTLRNRFFVYGFTLLGGLITETGMLMINTPELRLYSIALLLTGLGTVAFGVKNIIAAKFYK